MAFLKRGFYPSSGWMEGICSSRIVGQAVVPGAAMWAKSGVARAQS